MGGEYYTLLAIVGINNILLSIATWARIRATYMYLEWAIIRQGSETTVSTNLDNEIIRPNLSLPYSMYSQNGPCILHAHYLYSQLLTKVVGSVVVGGVGGGTSKAESQIKHKD